MLRAEDPFQEVVTEAERAEEETKFCHQLVQEIRTFWKIPTEPLALEDFFYNMHRIEKTHSHDIHDAVRGWSMSTAHWVAVSMAKTHACYPDDDSYAPFAVLECALGNLVVYSEAQVTRCIVELALCCKSHGHLISFSKKDE